MLWYNSKGDLALKARREKMENAVVEIKKILS